MRQQHVLVRADESGGGLSSLQYCDQHGHEQRLRQRPEAEQGQRRVNSQGWWVHVLYQLIENSMLGGSTN